MFPYAALVTSTPAAPVSPAAPVPMTPKLSAEDAKLVTLARATRVRTGTREGAAVRDGDGRAYAAAAVTLPSLQLSALRVAVSMAASSGAGRLEAAALVSEDDPTADDIDAVLDLGGPGTPVHLAGPDGTPRATVPAS